MSFVPFNPFKLPSCDGSTTKSLHEDICRENSTTDGESTTGETDSMYQLQDDRLGGCSDGDRIPDPYEPPNRVAIFMAGDTSPKYL